MGRPSKYTEKLATKILLRIARGESLRSICNAPDMPTEGTVRGWNVDNREGFSSRYANARLDCIHSRLDAAHDKLADDNGKTYTDELGNRRVDSGAVQLARTYADLVKWEASKLIPEYRDKTSLEVAGQNGGPIAFRWAGPGETANDG